MAFIKKHELHWVYITCRVGSWWIMELIIACKTMEAFCFTALSLVSTLYVPKFFFKLTFLYLWIVIGTPYIGYTFLLIFQTLSIFFIFLCNLIIFKFSDCIKGQNLDKLGVNQNQERHNITSQIGCKGKHGSSDRVKIGIVCSKHHLLRLVRIYIRVGVHNWL